MARLKSFSNTEISVFKTQDDLTRLVERHGITATNWTHLGQTDQHEFGRISFAFEWQPEAGPVRPYRVSVDYREEVGPKGGRAGTTREQAARALFWHVKNIFDAVEYGIVTLEEAFLPYMLGAGENGDQTFAEAILPRIDELIEGKNMRALIEGRK